MKHIKSFTISFFLIHLLMILIGAGCEKEEWEEIDLLPCEWQGEVIEIVTNYSGTIIKYPSTNAWVITGTVTGPPIKEFVFSPCNLPVEYQKENLEIIFDGELIDVQDWLEGNPQADFVGAPLNLTYAKIRIK